MRLPRFKSSVLSSWKVVAAVLVLGCWGWAQTAKMPPQVNEIAPDFELKSLKGDNVKLSEITQKNKVVLVVLRGYPGYQCPVCNKQVGQFLAEADKFKAAGSEVVFVYPGPSDNLSKRAEEFFKDKTVPEHFRLLVDPDYRFTNAYRLRWDAANETAYPSTFIIQKNRKISFAKISQSHGGRTKPEDVLKELTDSP